MKNAKKILSVILTCCLIMTMFCFVSSAAGEVKNYLLLGDSITQGFGVANPDEACYGKIVADTNGYNYRNDSMFARNSDTMLNLLKTSYKIRQDVAWADIISLSIGSNDYLANDDVVMLVIGALLGINNKTLDEIADAYYVNLCDIIDEIHSLNPDVVILIQNAYVTWTGFAGRAFNAGVSRVNGTIDKYLENHPDNGVYFCDISPAITGHKDRVADDCVHPNDKGNVAIAELVLGQLHEMGLGTETVPVVNAKGINYNYFTNLLGDFFGPVVSVIVKVLTGNAVNIIR